jgi:8-oxo-dGTP pyrophosphatase MutT (NUDIX family)
MHIRPTARLLVIDQQQRLLLFHIHDGISLHANRPDLTVYWLTPGGGLEPDESFEQAAQRELWEETGLHVEALGPWVWTGKRMLNLKRGQTQIQERFFVAHVVEATVSINNLLPYEQVTHRAFRWWTLGELEASSDLFLPPALPTLIRPVLHGDFPSAPLELAY